MHRPAFLALAATAVLLGGLATPSAAAYRHPAALPAAVDDGLTTDLTLVAQARGWSLEQAFAHHTVAERFGAVQERIATVRPELYAGARLAPRPGDPPTLYLKGKADALVREVIAAAGLAVVLVEDRPLSWLESQTRSEELNRLLAALGFTDIMTSFDETTSTVEAVAARAANLPGRPEEVLALLPIEYRRGVTLSLVDGQAGADFHAYGGMRVRDDGVNECTSGWAVTDGVTTGVTTAGHCDGINEIVEPGVAVHILTHQAEHRGVWGDVEWKTSTHLEPDDFYASSTDVRDVSAVEPRPSITVGEAICSYGRSSNVRDCSETVFRTSVSCTVSGVSNSRLVAMDDNNALIPGDSGGGWSFGNKAYGSVKGICTVQGAARDVFSVADLYDEALGVSVRTS